MNGYERISRTLAGQPVDRTPMMLHAFMAAAGEAGITMQQYREKPELMANSLVDFAEKYELDGVLTDVDTALEAGALGAVVDFPEMEPARVEEKAPGSIEEIIEGISVERLLANWRVQAYLEALRLIKQRIGGRLFLRGNADAAPFSLATMLYGIENMLVDILDESTAPRIMALIERCYEVHLAFHEKIRETGADATSFGDSLGGPDLISRAMHLKFAHPFHLRLREALTQRGIGAVCHICGNLNLILDDVAAVGFAGVEVDYKTDVKRAQASLAGHSVMFGPIDPSGVFFYGTSDQVELETRKVLETFGSSGLVIGAGCALPRGVPEANIQRFVETVKQYPHDNVSK